MQQAIPPTVATEASPLVSPFAERRGVRPRELAKQLGVAANVIYSALYAGEFGPVWHLGKTGRALVIPRDAVDKWLASKAA